MKQDPIHLKRLKRKRKLAARVKCHGTKEPCTEAKKHTKKKPVISKRQVVLPRAVSMKPKPVKENVFKRVSKWLRKV